MKVSKKPRTGEKRRGGGKRERESTSRTNDDDQAKIHDELDGVGPDLGENEEGQESQERARDGNRQQDQHDVAQHIVVTAPST
jgi:hypothetical protein